MSKRYWETAFFGPAQRLTSQVSVIFSGHFKLTKGSLVDANLEGTRFRRGRLDSEHIFFAFERLPRRLAGVKKGSKPV
jgi:hypothetical protein